MSRRKKPPSGQAAGPAPAPKPAGLSQRSARQKWVTVPRVPQLTAAPAPDEAERKRREEAERRQQEEAKRAKEATTLAEARLQLGQATAELLLLKNRIEKLETDLARQRDENASLGRQADRLRRDLDKARTTDPEETERLKKHVAVLLRENEQLTEKVRGLEAGRKESEERLASVLTAAYPSVELLDGSLEVLAELPSRKQVLAHLREIDAGRAPKGKALESVGGYRELHFGGTKRDNGRLYYGRTRAGKYRVLIAVKLSDQAQERDLAKLRRSPLA